MVTGRRRKAVIVGVLVMTAVLGAAAPGVELSTSLEQFRGGTPEAAANDYIETNMSGGADNVTQALVVIRGKENVLTKDQYLQHLRAQRALLANETVASTLHPAQRPLSIANVVAIIAIKTQNGTDPENVSVEPRPPLAEQIRVLENLNEYRVDLYTSYAVGVVLDDVSHTWPPGGGFAFVPTSYEPRGKTAKATAIVVSHREETSPKALTAAQTAMDDVVESELNGTNAIVVGDGIINAELRQSSMDSLRIVGPVALLLMIIILVFAYRDLLDVALGLLGVGMVLVWTFGYMGWANVTFNQLFVAVPVLLMGLSIDYAIHVFMRHREEREELWADRPGPDDPGAAAKARTGESVEWERDPSGVRRSMTVALTGVGTALVLVTFTTATGFLSNLVSGVAPIREFGVVSAVGIVAALVVFGGFIPALKVELDTRLESRGVDRHERPFGAGGGRLTTFLAMPVAAARVAPWGVIGLALLATLAGAYGATTVQTDFQQDDLLVEDAPEWTEGLPEPFRPANYTAQEHLDYVNRNDFIYEGTLTEILVRGDVTQPDTLERVQAAMDAANRTDVALQLPNKNPGTRSTLTMMWTVANRNASFNRTLARADTDGDRIPDRNLERVYDAFYAAVPEAASTMLDRKNGEYVAIRIKVPVNGTASETVITRQVRNATGPVQGDGLRAIATGQPIMNQAVAAQLLDTVVESLVVTMGVVLVGLTAAFRFREEDWTLGAVTLVPVVFAVTWIVGTMSLFGIPFNVMTALITSFTIGIGVDYSIHVAERYTSELERQESVGEALQRAVFGTGGAMLGGAVTDIAGVGVLAFAILVPLQQFGIITALTIAYSFLASVVVLPSLLVVWTELVGPEAAGAEAAEATE